MSKILLALSFLSLILLILCAAFIPGSELFAFASTSLGLQIAREILSGILFVQILTHPPRNIYFRILAGIISVGIGSWAVYSTFMGRMLFLDTFSMLGAAFAIGITALEYQPSKENTKSRSSSSPLIA